MLYSVNSITHVRMSTGAAGFASLVVTIPADAGMAAAITIGAEEVVGGGAVVVAPEVVVVGDAEVVAVLVDGETTAAATEVAEPSRAAVPLFLE